MPLSSQSTKKCSGAASGLRVSQIRALVPTFPKVGKKLDSQGGKWHWGNMRIIARSTLVNYYTAHPETKSSLLHWETVAKNAEWSNTNEVQANFSKAKVLDGERVRFEVAGGNYRMIVAFRFDIQIAFIKFIGTHKEYNNINALTVSYF